MDGILRNDIISNKNMKREEHISLQQLKETRFLTHRVFGRNYREYVLRNI